MDEIVVEVDASTGVTVERPFTEDERLQRELDLANAAAEAAVAAEREQARLAAVEHALSLGFTEEMIAVMFPGLGVTGG